MKQTLKILLIVAPVVLTGCKSLRPTAGNMGGVPFVGFTSSTTTTETRRDLTERLETFREAHARAVRVGDDHQQRMFMEHIQNVKQRLAAQPGFWRGQFWDWRPGERLKSVASLAAAAAGASFAAGMWDMDDITGGGNDETKAINAASDSLRASAERNKNVIRVGNGNTIEAKDLNQADTFTLEAGANNTIVIDFQQDTGSFAR